MTTKIYPTGNSAPAPNQVCVGIDLGTTTTLCSTVRCQDVNLQKSMTIPVQHVKVKQESPNQYDNAIIDQKVASIVAIHDGKFFIGSNLYHLKGTPGYEYKTNIFYHWKLELGIDQTPMYPHAVDTRLDMPYKIAGGILNYIKRAGLHKKDELPNTIITVPASFQANQRNDVLKAAQSAKIRVNDGMLIDEPNAAFLGYFNNLPDAEKERWSYEVRNSNVMIIDFGGGTLDLSILNVDFRPDTGITISNIAISRYNDLGGQDIDMILAEEYLYPKVVEAYPEIAAAPLSDLNSIILPQLATIGERLKVGICNKINLRVVDRLANEVDLSQVLFEDVNSKVQYKNETYSLENISITARDFEEFFDKIFTPKDYQFKYQDKLSTSVSSSISSILEKAQIGLDRVHFVLFAGGSSYNPYLISKTTQKLSNSKPLTSHIPDTLIADGAAVYSYFYYLYGISLITPITSETIGITLEGNQFYPIIERGKSLPQEVTLPQFQLQSNLTNEIVVPICINAVDFPIGEIRAPLPSVYDLDAEVRIDAKITRDKVFEMKVYIEEQFVGNATLENPYAIGISTEEERTLFSHKAKLNQAIQRKSYQDEKEMLHSLIWDYSAVNNYKGCLESAEKYLKRFDDQDEYVWNMHYIANDELGRKEVAKKSLEHALQLNPANDMLVYNYSLLLEEDDGAGKALDYLDQNNGKYNLSGYKTINLKMLILRNKIGEDVQDQAKSIVEDYLNNSFDYSDFVRRTLLPRIFKIAGRAYAYVDPKRRRQKEDENKYLRSSGSPMKAEDDPDVPF